MGGFRTEGAAPRKMEEDVSFLINPLPTSLVMTSVEDFCKKHFLTTFFPLRERRLMSTHISASGESVLAKMIFFL